MFENVMYTNKTKRSLKLDDLLSEYQRSKKNYKIFIKNKCKLQRMKKKRKKEFKKDFFFLLNQNYNFINIKKPEETYEIWNQHDNLNINLKKYENNENKTLSFLIENLIQENVQCGLLIKKILTGFNTYNYWTKSSFLTRSNGLEILHKVNYMNDNDYYIRFNVNVLTNLLHINILKHNYILAYKIFCLLIRVPSVDLKSLWPIGIEIFSDKNIDLPLNISVDIKRIQYFEWLYTFNTITNVNSANRTGKSLVISNSVWRLGSKFHVPNYVEAYLWYLLEKKEIKKLKEKLEELVLQPPYNNDGITYFIMINCIFENLVEIVNKLLGISNNDDFETNSDAHVLIEKKFANFKENLKEIKSNISKCDNLKFCYSKSHISSQIYDLTVIIDKRFPHLNFLNEINKCNLFIDNSRSDSKS